MNVNLFRHHFSSFCLNKEHWTIIDDILHDFTIAPFSLQIVHVQAFVSEIEDEEEEEELKNLSTSFNTMK